MSDYELIGSLGCGSAIVELALAQAALPARIIDIPFVEDGPARTRLLSLNPLGQVPVLITPAGDVLTESAAMILHLADAAPGANLVPAPHAPDRAAFLNTLIVLVGALYPTFTYGDFPERYTGPGPCAALLKSRTVSRRETLWRHLEHTLAPLPSEAGGARTALDLYIAVMTRWEPGPDWFARETPRLAAIAQGTVAFHATVLQRHFPA